MKSIIFYILVLVPYGILAQNEVDYLFEEMPNDTVFDRSIKTHTSVRPFVRMKASTDKDSYIRATALGDLNYFQTENSGYKLGLGAELKGSIKNKFYFRLAGVQGLSQANSLFGPKTYVSDSIQGNVLYTDLRGRISYTPNHIFNFQAGLDHNFIGEGARSLFLSDYGTPYPFGQIRMRFWRVEYSILYQFLREEDNNRWEGKFASSHHLTFNAAKWLNFGVFESVVFQPKDTLLNRGFDVEYLNPFVFYRPQEYSLGSSDNVLIGAELNAHWQGHTFYSQFIIDEFSLNELRAKSGWWANKFGAQLGVKGRFKTGQHKFFYRAEYNYVRPYTYAHLSEELNYGNQGTTLSHPYGSNFMEMLGEVKWQHKAFFGKFLINYYQRANNKDSLNYGNNIYDPYINKPGDYGHYFGQGEGFNGGKAVVTFGYQLLKHGKLNAFIENHFDYNTLNDKVKYSMVVGVRSLLWNDHRNY